MQYFLAKEVHGQIQNLRKRGGKFERAASKASDILIKISSQDEDPFGMSNLTHHGETRIKHCIKYDLPGFVRFITIQNNGLCLLAYIGDKGDCEKWLEAHKGMNLAIDPNTKEMVSIKISENIFDTSTRSTGTSDYSEGKLYSKLKSRYFDVIADLLPHSKLKVFLLFDSTVTEDELLGRLSDIEDTKIQNVFFDVFLSLREGDIEGAKNRILEFESELKLVADAENEEVESIISNDNYLKINELEAEYLRTLLENKDWYDWMLFLHPNQREIVNFDYSGSARLLGVSGSGKTCVLVHRAVRLAEKYLGEKILILTLNKSLSKLIEKLITLLLENTNRKYLLEHIKIKSFWELCREKLIEFDDRKLLAHRIFDIKTDKHEESVDEIWEEYYKCKLNNSDADVFFSLHQMLLARSIYPQDYLKQEVDWLRSAFGISEREHYLTIERDGRTVPFNEEDRKIVLSGLERWEQKMEDIGVIDALGFANAISQHMEKITPEYRCILVDEIQDFGTMELKIIRKLVGENENDLFICGDLAQQVYNKHHRIKQAGINILPEGFVKILKNYRNSKEILEAAYQMFQNNVEVEKYTNDGFEILNPEFANFSSPKPFLRKGISLNSELNSAIIYLKELLADNEKEKACIAICGFTIVEIAEFARINDLKVLDGSMDLSTGNLFLSDLEQTKGFEFDRMIILNCSKDVIPNPVLPKEESFREVSKLYVAMTRAKKDLVMSYSREASSLFNNCLEFFTSDNWEEHVEVNSSEFSIKNMGIIILSKEELIDMNGKDFLYHKKAVGFSRELQNKLLELVAGKSITDEKGRKIGWSNMALLLSDINGRQKDIPTLTRIFGSSVYPELENKLN